MARHLRRIDGLWLTFLGVVGVGMCIYSWDSLFSSSVLLTGIACVGLIAAGRNEGNIIGIYNSFAYAWLAHRNGLWGEVFLNLGFFVPTSIACFLMWRPKLDDRVVRMRGLAWKSRGWIVAASVAITLAQGWGLNKMPGQNTPYIDATTNTLSYVATFLMMWRFKEQWLFYITLNFVSVMMWYLRWLNGGPAADLMVFMWVLFLLNSVYGYWRWHQGSIKLPAPQAAEA